MAEWQTQRIQNPPPSRVCGFDSRLRHHLFTIIFAVKFFDLAAFFDLPLCLRGAGLRALNIPSLFNSLHALPLKSCILARSGDSRLRHQPFAIMDAVKFFDLAAFF